MAFKLVVGWQSLVVSSVLVNIKKFLLNVVGHNNKVKKTSFHNYPGGLGLKNVRDRLNLLYPLKHKFKIEEDSREFNVYLEIEL
jgi:LytS/YehU family sensor histidine kinase